jgi:hypothetical protein
MQKMFKISTVCLLANCKSIVTSLCSSCLNTRGAPIPFLLNLYRAIKLICNRFIHLCRLICRDLPVFQAVFIGALSSSNDIRFPVHTSSRQHNILYLGLDIGPLILHTNSRQGKNAPQILDSNSRQKKILVIESTVTNYESKIQ